MILFLGGLALLVAGYFTHGRSGCWRDRLAVIVDYTTLMRRRQRMRFGSSW